MAVDSFLKIEGEDVEGESVVEGHERQASARELQRSALTNAGSRHTATGGGVGKGNVSDMSFIDEHWTSRRPLLMAACAAGEHFDKATLFVRKAGGEAPVTYMEIEMKDILDLVLPDRRLERRRDEHGERLAELREDQVHLQAAEGGLARPDAEVTQGWDIAVGKKM